MFKVIKAFRDRTDNDKRYKVGDSYSHNDEERIAFLIEKKFIEEVVEEKKPKKLFKLGGK